MTDSSPWSIVLHWTAGADGIVEIEHDSYHFIVTRDGQWMPGAFAPEDNIPPLGNHYAQHTRAANSFRIGVALDAMHGARERPFDCGRFPITPVQLEAMARGVADLCRKYRVPITRERLLTHAEVERTLGIKQRAKWDVTWLPGMERPGDPIEVGDRLREMVRDRLEPDELRFAAAPKPESWWQKVMRWFS